MYDLIAIGNAILDIIMEVSDEELSKISSQKGSFNLMEVADQQKIIETYTEKHQSKISGGAAANSLVIASQLGIKSALLACYANDSYGNFYGSEFKELGIGLLSDPISSGATGTCAVLVTPDGERTMHTCLGVSADIKPEMVSEDLIKSAKLLLIEGYLLTSDNGNATVEKTVNLAKKHGIKIASTLCAPFIIEFFRERLDFLVNNSEICFSNADEAMAYSGTSSAEEALNYIAKIVPQAVVTLNKEGALVSKAGKNYNISTEAVRAIDSTGAGDAFCGAYLAQVLKGYEPDLSAKLACSVAGKVVQRLGARIDTEIVKNCATEL